MVATRNSSFARYLVLRYHERRQNTDVSFHGPSIAQVNNIGAAECCERCGKTLGCKGYTLMAVKGKSPAVCHLKATVANRKHNSGAVSAALKTAPSGQQSYKQSYR
ncbi:hypothetical protein PybrP1_008768 [[Pythium] brassicae (nom. inval.)]|nr:hypothetical protein PybrP1_008768 [[Pythium] brassicae (nom. inval.)]